MKCTVLLLHELPDGSAHLDWMLERPDLGALGAGEAPGLLTFRLDREGEAFLGVRPFVGRLLPDHRRVYLEYEGPVSGDRGTVRRLESGTCSVSEAGVGLRIAVAMAGHAERVWMATPRQPDDGLWEFELAEGV